MTFFDSSVCTMHMHVMHKQRWHIMWPNTR